MLLKTEYSVKKKKTRQLRTVPTFPTAHTFCASRDGPRGSDFLRTVATNSKVFFARFINMREKKISASVIEIRKENWG